MLGTVAVEEDQHGDDECLEGVMLRQHDPRPEKEGVVVGLLPRDNRNSAVLWATMFERTIVAAVFCPRKLLSSRRASLGLYRRASLALSLFALSSSSYRFLPLSLPYPCSVFAVRSPSPSSWQR